MRLFLSFFLSLLAAIGLCQAHAPNSIEKHMRQYSAALKAKDYKKALSAVSAAIKENPPAEARLIGFKLDVMWFLPDQRSAGLAYAKKAADDKFKQNALTLNNIAWSIVSTKAPIPASYFKDGIRLAQRSVTVASAGGRANDGTLPYALDTLAYGYYRVGDHKKAVDAGERARRESGNVPPNVKKEINEHLEMFKASNMKKT
jgi:hypothetical protein